MVEYLGMVISHNKVAMDPVKVAGVQDWPAPSNKKEVQSFLGFTNFYRRFIQDISDHARLLFNLMKNDAQWSWGADQQLAFDKLKDSITSAPVLISPDLTRPFQIEADSSDFVTGAVLSQVSPEDDKWHLLHSSPSRSWPLNGITRSMIRRCSQSSGPCKSGGILLKAPNTSSKYGLITRTWSIS
jgi:RNase H-like domain found in reverse transcriptase